MKPSCDYFECKNRSTFYYYNSRYNIWLCKKHYESSNNDKVISAILVKRHKIFLNIGKLSRINMNRAFSNRGKGLTRILKLARNKKNNRSN